MIARVVVILVLLLWAPLLLLSVAEESLITNQLAIPFLYDAETHLRLLIALPLLIAAEAFVFRRLWIIADQFIARDMIAQKSIPQFEDAMNSAKRMRGSVKAEGVLLALVYVVGILFVNDKYNLLEVSSWRGHHADGAMLWSAAGWWLRWVSLPVFQFLLLRWYFLLFIWGRFLWRVSKLELNIIPTHSDRCGGLGFLSGGCLAFAPVLLAQGTLLAAMMTNRIFFTGAKPSDFRIELFGLVAVMILVMLAPMMVFCNKLAKAKRNGRLEYGKLVQKYVFEFDRKWLRGSAFKNEPLIGNADIQSLADLSNAYTVIERMRPAPFGIQTVAQLLVIILIPVSPLALTVMPVEELTERLIKLVF